MEFLTTSDVEQVFNTLSRAETLNKSIHSFFNLIGTEINGADLKGCSARVTGDEEAITVTTPHANVFGIADHFRDGSLLSARITFSVVRTGVDGKKSASEIMSVVMTGNGFITALNGTRLTRSVRCDTEIAYELAILLISAVQSKLPSISDHIL
ncbi:hypothetical protein [Burkholderia cepacia]|uniref:hypothetical protein n=1 Tax=Burkholderia cepacia TaxID=292 RepID=UPI001CF5A81E|nr:hypothetical protein [Burkholderia cepacia]MCA7941578.1 hypothetical protein [Burkholderia cepacia]